MILRKLAKMILVILALILSFGKLMLILLGTITRIVMAFIKTCTP